MMSRTIAGLALVALVAGGALSACGSSDDPETTPSSSASASQSGTDPESDEGRYNAALKTFSEYQSQLPTYQRDPKPNAATKAFYTKYWVDPAYQLKVVAALDKGDVETSGAITILRSEQLEVTSAQVRLRQCVDYSTATATEKGKTLPKNQKRPQWQYVTLQRQSASLPWKIETLDNSTKKDRPCAS